MHGATVEDEWCAKVNIFLLGVYLSVGASLLRSLPPLESAAALQLRFKTRGNNVSRLSFCLSFVWNLELKDYIVVFLVFLMLLCSHPLFWNSLTVNNN